jgi:ATP synthase F0 subunit b
VRSLLHKAVPTVTLLVLFASPALAEDSMTKKVLGIPGWIWMAVNLALFLGFLAWIIGKPMKAFLSSRSAAIKQELEEARHKLEEAEELRTQVLSRLEKVESEVQGIKDRAEKDGSAEAARIEEQARAEEERFLNRVKDEIARRQAETRKALAEDTVTLTTEIARELLQREMTDEDRKRVLQRSLDAMQTLERS